MRGAMESPFRRASGFRIGTCAKSRAGRGASFPGAWDGRMGLMAAQHVPHLAPKNGAPTPASLSLLSIPGDTPKDADTYWLREVYQADRVPQLTLRAVLLG